MTDSFALAAGQIFDGETLWHDHALLVREGRVEAIVPQQAVPETERRHALGDCLVAPGFVDLQVNGGGGVLFNNDPSESGIATICKAHAAFGTTALLVTLITDTVEIRETALVAGRACASAQVPGFLGLHLEGPHLSLSRKGTHDPALIRPMSQEDLQRLIAAAGSFGKALITIAPESVTLEQVKALSRAGYVISLGHTDTSAQQAGAYADAGASMVTHLFNAMSQFGNREPGLVGAALQDGRLSCGLIADGFHVDPVSMSVALRAKLGPARIFLVTDAMSTIGTEDDGFELNGRKVYRSGGRLTLADGTLAGADIDMLSCVRFVHERLGLPLTEALQMASRYPAEAIGASGKGMLTPGSDADLVVLDPKLALRSTWISGRIVAGSATEPTLS
ncbi:N-acetylglucosamine-6-phosphate deacetylase [Rhizobium sp. SSA_523]|uniref:N-acetylglucosamine-6-phosphate deacetylase n=1 Tax=Rhizobium sp. SSA_523 TaxID=2952477 RepID=UPI002090D878|nr:N-acetylglucosamine-6-phosphate deacetylase [Rhizobium sp. SSA_523]MCO5732328.1 N-acetylglucosamine-6-phosphate deacetylase [Rhizobium sp. SSA_523]WKC21270.1 N-acetylglucosamine-6-phosphate deacetylase [Rhizobium sp. SSA_523]